MIYYRVAFRVEKTSVAYAEQENSQEYVSNQPSVQVQSPTMAWKWRSTLLTSPHALFTLLRAYSYIPKDQIRVFFASSEADMDEMLLRQNAGRLSTSMSAEQFLSGQRINTLDVRRLEYELSGKSDSTFDEPYRFTMPESMRERIAWVKLMYRRQQGELES
jgi:hypothetical protein